MSENKDRLSDLKWSQWVQLKTVNLKDIPSNSGVYKLRWGSNGKPLPINRINGVDESGIMYIGQAKNIQQRIKALYRGFFNKQLLAHTAAFTYKSGYFDKKFKIEQLEICWSNAPKNEIVAHEYILINDYNEAYVDNPPLNISRQRK